MELLRLFFIGIILSSSYSGFSQNQSDYIPPLKQLEDSIVNVICNEFRQSDHSIKFDGRKSRMCFEGIYEERAEYFKRLCDKGYIVTDDEITPRLHTIVSRIEESVPEIQKGYFRVFLSRDALVNASSWGNGVIVMNLGILSRLKSDDEIAFVMGHEMGHDIMRHIHKRFESSCRLLDDKDLKKEVKSAERNETGTQEIFFRILSNKSLYSRMNEFEADSIGFNLMTAAGYDQRACSDVMLMLKDADYFVYNDSLMYSDLFGSDVFQFNEQWLLKADLNQSWTRIDSMFLLPDELKTHPFTKDRMNAFARRETSNAGTATEKNLLTPEFTSAGELSILESLIHFNDYGQALYLALQMKSKYNEIPYLDMVIAHTLFGTGYALKNRRFSFVVSFPHKAYPKSYNQLLSLLHGLSSDKLFTLFRVYYEKTLLPIESGEYKDLLDLFYKISQNPTDDYTKAINEFETKYPDSKFELGFYKRDNQ